MDKACFSCVHHSRNSSEEMVDTDAGTFVHPTSNMNHFIANIPKAELHVHIEGTLEPELMLQLAKRNNISLPYKSVVAVKQAYHFQDLQSFLDIYYQSAAVLITEQDFYDLMMAYLQKAAQQNIRHTEIFFDPQTHTHRGIQFSVFMNGFHRAIQEAQQKLNISAKLIMCFLRDLTEDDAIATFKQALPFKDWIVAVGLDSAEKNNPPSKFKKVYEMAHELGWQAVAHAGEESTPAYILEALDILKVKRIDHGVRCFEDAALVKRLVKEEITLTVCPLSNVQLCVFPHMEQHPIKKMLAANLRATINSDDPAFFGGYVNENIAAVVKDLKITPQEIYQLEKNAFLGSFITASEKQKFITELDSFYQKYQ